MSKSNTEEVIAVLWFILAAITTGWVFYVAAALGTLSLLSAMYFGAKQIKTILDKENEVE